MTAKWKAWESSDFLEDNICFSNIDLLNEVENEMTILSLNSWKT